MIRPPARDWLRNREGGIMRLTVFSWGYYGWGGAPTRFVEAVNSVERARGFEPPLFVDTRIRRAVRAKGFIGDVFAGRG